MRFRSRSAERGFTLIEILVVLALIAAVVAIVAPTLFSQLTKGDVTRVSGDLSSVSSAMKAFRVDVSPAFAGDAEDLVNAINGADRNLDDGSYSAGQTNRWDGPYLEAELASAGVAGATDVAFTTSFGGSVLSDFWRFDSSASPTPSTEPAPGTGDWVAVRIGNLATADFTTLDDELDDGDGFHDGRYRWNGSELIYLAVQQ